MTTSTPTEHTTKKQTTFVVRLRAEGDVNAVLALRSLLKSAWRKYRLRCISAIEQDTNNARPNNQ
jgi:hypothetical protein